MEEAEEGGCGGGGGWCRGGGEKAEEEEKDAEEEEEPMSYRPRRLRWISMIAYMSVLVMTAALHVHRQYGHVPPWRKSLSDISLSPRGTRRIFRFAGKRTGNVSPPFRQRPDRQRTAILLLFISNPTRRHRYLRTVLPVLLQTETSRNGAAGHSERLFHR